MMLHPTSLSWRDFAKTFALYFIFFVLAFSAILSWTLYQRNQQRVSGILEQEQSSLEAMGTSFFQHIERGVLDLNILRQGPIIRSYLTSGSAADLAAVNEQLALFLGTVGLYDRIELLDRNGGEMARVERRPDGPRVARPSELTTGQASAEAREVFQLPDSAIYLSRIDLLPAQADPGVAEPSRHRPSLRIATPVSDDRGEPRGVLVMHLLFESLLENTDQFQTTITSEPVMLNSQGLWLHRNLSGDRSLPGDGRSAEGYGALYPKAWRHIRQTASGHLATAEGTFVFVTIRPAQQLARQIALNRTPQSVLFGGEAWKLVSRIPAESLRFRPLEAFRQNEDWLTICLLLLFVCGLLAWARAYTQGQKAVLRDREEKLRMIMDNTSTLAYLKDRAGHYLFVNRRAAEVFSRPVEEVVGKTDFDLLPLDVATEFRAHDREVLAGGKPVNYEDRLPGPQGEMVYLSVKFPLRQTGYGDVICGISTDITERKRLEQELERKRHLLAESQRIAHIGSWLWHLQRGEIEWSEEARRIFGFDFSSGLTDVATYVAAVHPDDQDLVNRTIESILRTHQPYEIKYRVLHPDGSIRHIQDRGEVVFDAKGEPEQVFGTVLDVTDQVIAARKLRESEQMFRQITETVEDVFWVGTPGTRRILYLSPAFERIWGQPSDRILANARALGETVHPDDRERVLHTVRDPNARWEMEYRILRPDGGLRWIFARSFPVFDEQGNITSVAGIATDITERKLTEEQLRQAHVVFESTHEAIIIADAARTIINVNPAYGAMLGFGRDEAIGTTLDFGQRGDSNAALEPPVQPGDSVQHSESLRHSETFYYQLWETLRETGRWQGEIWCRRRSGELFPAWVNISVVTDSQGRVTHHVAALSDISAIKEAESRLLYLAHHDSLTGLPNRLAFQTQLDQALIEAQREKTKVGLFFLDLDRFKYVNDTLGHAAGDELLQSVAQTLRHCVREEDTVSRLGGDEFTIILRHLHQPQDVLSVAEKIITSIEQPVMIAGRWVAVGVSIGISLYPVDAFASESLCMAADAALYRAKERGKGMFEFYSTEMTERAARHLVLENELRMAIQNQEFVLHYQPQFSLETGEMVGVEALLRWSHPTQGLLGPDHFIWLAEETGLIIKIGAWVMAEACRQKARWQQLGLNIPLVSVNVSVHQLVRDNFVQRVMSILADNGMKPGQLQLEVEVTESVLQDSERSEAVIRTLSAQGIKVAIDDFGTGYSSLSHLRRLPIDKIKIAGVFMQDIPHNENDKAIAAAIVSLGKSLQIPVIAEGVETGEQMDFLREIGCDLVQGYVKSRPLSSADLIESFKDSILP